MQRPWITSPSYEAALQVLVEARKEAGLTQRELAERIGKPRSFISKIENRVRRVDMIELLALAAGLQLDPTELIARLHDQVGPDLVF